LIGNPYKMPDITFIFRINDDLTRGYGKICLDYLSDDHEGVDLEIKPQVRSVIDKYREKHSLPPITDLHLGVIGVTDEYCSFEEVNIFDIYITYKCQYCYGECFS